MLQLKNIIKKYGEGENVVTALNGVSIAFRENEFVSILGHSGCGKTTLLNIIGGLDHYTSGDLIINGVSTKQYKDRDWDAYRNHSIGFIFQSYNLIPHQTVLSNVELALTISGVSKSERRKRAKEALEKVGLGNQLHKRPNQMSGGQMQRVAIARALVNDPDILLADEPTGALDTETSIQVMNLLKEVAKDRLVVMVTHNPELAEEYATRIVKLRDGKIIDDSDSFTPDAKGLKAPEHKNMGKSSMSFLTSLALSFNNLRTKKGRTILTAFAGSIGIIGIALILSLSNGVNTYIKHVEEDTLSEYPLAIQNKNIDITSFMERMGVIKEENSDAEVRELQTLSSVFSQISSNDLKSFKAYLEDSNSGVMKYANAVEYTYNVAPHIYRVADDGSYRQVNPDQTFAALSGGASMQMSGMNPMMSMDVFMPLPENEKLYREQYEVMAGRWPENHNECVLVLSADGRVLDLVLYAVGFKDSSELDKMIELYFKGEDINITSEPGTFKYKDFIDISFKLADATDYYEYDDNYDVFVDKKDNKQYMKNLLKNGEDLTIVGVVKPESSSGAAMLSGGIYYHNSLIDYIIEQNKDSEIVGKQLENPEVDVFTGKKFSDAKEGSAMDLSSLFSIDEEALKKAFDVDSDMMNFDPSMFEGMDFSSMDMSGLQFDLSGMDFSSIDMSGLNFDNVTPAPDMQGINLEDMLKNISVDISSEEMQRMFGELVNGYMAEAAKDPSTDYSKLGEALGQYLRSDNARTIIRSEVEDVLSGVAQALPKTQTVTDMISDIMSGLPGYIEEKGAEDISLLPAYINEYLNTVEVQAKINSFVEDINAKLSEAGLSEEELAALMNRLYQGYEDYSLENELPQPSKLMDSFTAYLGSDAGRSILSEGIQKAVNTEEISKQFEKSFAQIMSGYGDAIQKQMGSAMSDMAGQISSEIQKQMTSVMGQMSSEISRQMAGNTSLWNLPVQQHMK